MFLIMSYNGYEHAYNILPVSKILLARNEKSRLGKLNWTMCSFPQLEFDIMYNSIQPF